MKSGVRKHLDRTHTPGSGKRLIAVMLTVATSTLAFTASDDVISAQAVPGLATSSLDGTAPGHAAASCFEIKQVHPASVNGVYWLRTEAMQRPDQFYCDMTTDGGGWVLIGRGREGWTFRDYGQSTPQNVRTIIDGTAAFSPAALSTETINHLLNGANVSELVDGVRVRRATQVTPGPADWQELRWRMADLTSWSWAFGGGHRLSSFGVDGVGATGSNTSDSSIRVQLETGAGNRDAPGGRQWFTYPWSGHGGLAGFSFRGNVGGQNNATSYLWEFNTENNAIPFAQVFLRPTLTTPGLALIPSIGTPAQTLSPLVSDVPEQIAGGVVGVRKQGDTEPEVDSPVLAITTFGDRVYVGGKFDDVRDTATGNLIDQNYLAAFDRQTGAWIPTFTPQLDGTVYDLAVVDGKLIVAGQFTNVNGVSLTAGLAALDPTSGIVVPTWRASMELSGSTDRPVARTIDVEGSWIYVGGNFTKVTSLVGTRNEARLGRVRVSDGHADNAFVPDVNGVPYDLDAANGRVYVVGDFDGVNGNTDKGVSVVDASNGTVVPGLAPAVYTTSTFSRKYQQAVLAVGDTVFQGGSEHNTHVYSENGYNLLRSHVTATRGGDTQALARIGDVVYQASHGNFWIFEDAQTWPDLTNYSRVDDYKWVGAFSSSDYSYDSTWVPSMDTAFNEGVWALHADVDGCLWFGGDILGGAYVNGQRQYLESFSKFCQRDAQAPTTPGNAIASPLTSGGVRLDWSTSTDDFAGFVGYEVLRNDRVISSLVYGVSFVDPIGTTSDRYFVRAVDVAGNRSASTTEVVPGDYTNPSLPTNLSFVVRPDATVDLTWTSSSDNFGVVKYLVLRNGVEIKTVPVITATPTVTTNVAGLGAGAHFLQVRAVDAAGNQSAKTPSVRVDITGPDVQRPTQPGAPQAAVTPGTSLVVVSWTAASDNVGVTGYRIRRNLVEVASVAGNVLTSTVDLGPGTHYVQIEAFDAAGNVSAKTLPLTIVIAGGVDTTKPSTPQNLTAVGLANGTIDVAWTASTDNVAVTGYVVLRNGVQVSVVNAPATAANLSLGFGDHYIQVQAVDAAGNASSKTPSKLVRIAAPDTQRPVSPGTPSATVAGDGTITVTWTAATDNVGVTSYRILRNGVAVGTVDGVTLSTTLVLGSGNHYIQISALDAAGNESRKTPSVLVTV
jgi:trimeric autotransporter adhesin